MKRWMIVVAILAAVAGVAGAGYLGFRSSQPQEVAVPQAPPTTPVTTCTVDQTVAAPGSLVNTHETKIQMPAAGSLAEVLVQPGDSVTAGQMLARLANPEQFQAAVASAQLALLQAQQARADLDQAAPLKTAQAQLAVEQAQAAVDKAQQDRSSLNYPRADATTLDKLKAELSLAVNALLQAQKYYDSLSGLPVDDPQRASAMLALANAQHDKQAAETTLGWYLGSPSQADISEADAQLALAKVKLAQAQADWNKVKQGPDSLEVALADAKVADAKATLASAQNALANIEIKAPFSGVILDVAATQGQAISAGADLFTLNNPQAVEVESTITQEDFPYIEIGQPASLFFDALPDETIAGTVTRIVPKRTGSGSPLYTVYLSVDHVPAKLVAGMSAAGAISIAQRKGVLCLPRAVVQASANGSAVLEVWANGQREQRTVQVGLRGDTSVEILSGLKEGERVVTQ
jgi:HlyD family secretion protein